MKADKLGRRQRQPRAAQKGNHEGRHTWLHGIQGGSQEQPRRDYEGRQAWDTAQQRRPRAAQNGDEERQAWKTRRQRQPGAAQKQRHEARQAWETKQPRREIMKGDKLGKQGRRDRQYFFLRFPCSLAFAHPPWPQVNFVCIDACVLLWQGAANGQ